MSDEPLDYFMIPVVSVDMVIEHHSGRLEPNPCKFRGAEVYIVDGEALEPFLKLALTDI
jgi:hypothetical protein